jgi:hypothetical protein
MFLDDYIDFMSEIVANEVNVIVLGDFNLHVNSDCPDALILTDMMQALGFEQHVNFPTHKAGNTLDLVFTECINRINILEVMPGPILSDHTMVLLRTEIQRSDVTVEISKCRNLSKLNAKKCFEDCNFETLKSDELESLIGVFEQRLSQVLDIHAPAKERRIVKRKNYPWFNTEIKEMRRNLRRRERVWRRYGEPHHWKALASQRATYKKTLFHAKVTTISEKVKQCEGNMKHLYNLAAELTGTTKKNPMPSGKTDEELAEDFVEYFMDKIQKIRDELKDTTLFDPHTLEIPELVTFRAVTEGDVVKIIKSMTKCCELDPIPISLLKSGLTSVLPIITRIINISLEKGLFPSPWKLAIINPLIKKLGLELSLANYRPVSNLSLLSKVLEKVVLKQFDEHCSTYHLMPDYQSAYRTGYSCETALIKLLDDLLWDMEKKRCTAMVVIDLSAAFDTVDHTVLIDVLHRRFGIASNALQWFKTYLSQRSCKVKVNSGYSSVRNLSFSVPQGSCAGPILYLAYASTMKDNIPENIALHGYADDHALKKSFPANDHAQESLVILSLEECLVNIKIWMNANRLKMNEGKTEFILFGSTRLLGKCNSNELNVNGMVVTRSDCIKYLE